MDLENLRNTTFLKKHNEIFISAFNLNYKNKKNEAEYQKFCELKYDNSYFTFSLFLMFLCLTVTIFEGILFFCEPLSSKILQYNLVMCVGLSISSALLLISQMFFDRRKNTIYKFGSKFFLHFLMEKLFLSITSIVIVYFKMGLEIVSFFFLIKILTNFLVALFVFRKFSVTLFILVINKAINYVFLLKLHVIKAVVYYIFTDFGFLIIKISFIYLFEYITRIYFYSLIRLAKEKQYILETLNSFNVSYFMSKNYEINDQTKMKFILKDELSHNGKICLEQIENLFQNVISIDNQSSEIEEYFSELIKNHQQFRFKRLIYILEKNPVCQDEFRKFKNFWTFKLKNEMNDSLYFQMYLKIKIKKGRKEESNKFLLFFDCSEFEETELKMKRPSEVTIEGIFLDVTQSYLKKEFLINTSFFSKYFGDVKISLCLLNQIINEKEIKSPIQKKITGSKIKHDTFKEKRLIDDKFISKKLLKNSKYRNIVYHNLIDSIEAIENFTKKEFPNHLVNSKSNSKMDYAIFTNEKVNLRKLMNSCIAFYRIYLKLNPSKRTVKLLADIDPNIPNYILSNKLSIKQVIMNLLSNSLKFTYQGEIKVVCRLKSKLELEQKQNIEIAVIDTGVGIEQDDLIRLSKPFGLRTFRQGGGLGLDIVNEILQELDSKLIINSVRNMGSAFSFILQVDSLNCFKELEIGVNTSKSSASNSSSEGFNNCNQNRELETNLKQINRTNSLMTLNEVKSEDFTIVYDRPLEKIKNDDWVSYSEIDDSSSCYEFQSYFEFNTPTSGSKPLFHRENQNKKPYIFNSNINNKHRDYLQNFTKLDKPLISNNEIVTTTNDWNNNVLKTEKKIINVLVICDDKNYHAEIIEKMQSISFVLENKYTSILPSCCHNPIEAINIIYISYLEKKYFDIVLCDEHTPFMKGADFAKLYKSTLDGNGLYPITFASLCTDSKISDLDRENNPNNIIFYDFFLNKYFKNEEIMIIINEVEIKNKI